MLKRRLNAYRISTKILAPKVNMLEEYADTKEGKNLSPEESILFKILAFKRGYTLFAIVTFKLWSIDQSENPQRFLRVTIKAAYS